MLHGHLRTDRIIITDKPESSIPSSNFVRHDSIANNIPIWSKIGQQVLITSIRGQMKNEQIAIPSSLLIHNIRMCWLDFLYLFNNLPVLWSFPLRGISGTVSIIRPSIR
mmetsp:Transcript_12342/g.1842  ORF Transcript_12342/g.1842 Transcript_12342/m.1842 type:complete len:109 (+) Transcript_12342:86-412(+)